MLSSALSAAKFTYSNVGILKPYFFSSATVQATPSDVEATLTMISAAIEQWPDDDQLKPIVEDAHKKCAFIWDTIKLKKKKHHEKWFSDWRSLSLESEYDNLMNALKILEHRYTMAILSKMSIYTPISTTHARPSDFTRSPPIGASPDAGSKLKTT